MENKKVQITFHRRKFSDATCNFLCSKLDSTNEDDSTMSVPLRFKIIYCIVKILNLYVILLCTHLYHTSFRYIFLGAWEQMTSSWCDNLEQLVVDISPVKANLKLTQFLKLCSTLLLSSSINNRSRKPVTRNK